MRDGDRTVVLVTHDMAAVERYCHRAMLLDEGEQQLHRAIPRRRGREYLRINFERPRTGSAKDGRTAASPDMHARVVEAWLEDEGGEPDRERRAGRADPAQRRARGQRDLAEPAFSLDCRRRGRGHGVRGAAHARAPDGGLGAASAAGPASPAHGDDREPADPGPLHARAAGWPATTSSATSPCRHSSWSSSSSTGRPGPGRVDDRSTGDVVGRSGRGAPEQ